MEIFYDALQFDDREPEDLFTGIKSHEPRFADILKQWVTGSSLTDYEKKITASILIFYPEYILNNGKAEESIELMSDYLQQPELQNPLNPEKGLFLYTLFLLLLKLGKKEESSEVLEKLEMFFILAGKNTGNLVNHVRSISDTGFYNKFKYPAFSLIPNSRENAFINILTLIIDCREILSLKPGFNISRLPGLPIEKLSVFEGINIRGQALEFYYNKEYDKASAIYRKMLLNKFEIPGTLTHIARLEMICGNIDKAQIFIVNAWRNRNEAPAYVLVRILYFIILINMLEIKPFDKWFGCIKNVLNQPDYKMQWDMDRVLAQYEKDIPLQQIKFLKALLEVLSGTDQEESLNKFDMWQKSVPIPFEEWPDFDTVY